MLSARLISVVILVLLYCMPPSQAALFPPEFMTSVVALGARIMKPSPPGEQPKIEWITIGTGFLYGYLVKDDPDPSKQLQLTVLVTARHVVEQFHDQYPTISIKARLNPNDPRLPGADYEIPYENWHFHKDNKIDLAITPINEFLIFEKKLGAKSFSATTAATTERMKDLGVSEGDGIFVLGFPMNLAGTQRNYAISRQGSIARISELFAKELYHVFNRCVCFSRQ